jgi:hypothetical protein
MSSISIDIIRSRIDDRARIAQRKKALLQRPVIPCMRQILSSLSRNAAGGSPAIKLRYVHAVLHSVLALNRFHLVLEAKL